MISSIVISSNWLDLASAFNGCCSGHFCNMKSSVSSGKMCFRNQNLDFRTASMPWARLMFLSPSGIWAQWIGPHLHFPQQNLAKHILAKRPESLGRLRPGRSFSIQGGVWACVVCGTRAVRQAGECAASSVAALVTRAAASRVLYAARHLIHLGQRRQQGQVEDEDRPSDDHLNWSCLVRKMVRRHPLPLVPNE